MAIGSWYKTPILEDKIATKILSESMKKNKGKARTRRDTEKVHAGDVIEIDSDSTTS